MTEYTYGNITLPGMIDITDPSYDEDVWCRINNFPIMPGTYECYAKYADNEETEGWGERVAVCGIRKVNAKADHFERRGMIGVDSGLAGFFNCDNRKVFEDEILHSGTMDVFFGNNYFCTSTGYGDGGYDVYAGFHNGEVVEVYIKFI